MELEDYEFNKVGYKILDTALGKSKMPWVMSSLCYDVLVSIPNKNNLAVLYGFFLGGN